VSKLLLIELSDVTNLLSWSQLSRVHVNSFHSSESASLARHHTISKVSSKLRGSWIKPSSSCHHKGASRSTHAHIRHAKAWTLAHHALLHLQTIVSYNRRCTRLIAHPSIWVHLILHSSVTSLALENRNDVLLCCISNGNIKALDDMDKDLSFLNCLKRYWLSLLDDWLQLSTSDEHLVEQG
jgi:hypothetical protein